MKNDKIISAEAKEEELYDKDKTTFCGSCCWFKNEDVYGWGNCYHEDNGYGDPFRLCSDESCRHFVSTATMRSHIELLEQYKRSAVCDAFGDAVCFAIEYMKRL